MPGAGTSHQEKGDDRSSDPMPKSCAVNCEWDTLPDETPSPDKDSKNLKEVERIVDISV